MHARGQFPLQRIVDQALASDLAKPGKGGRGYRHGEMALAAGAGAGMAGVTMRFVDHNQPGRRKPLGQLAMDYICDAHREACPAIPVRSCSAAAAARKPARSSTT